MKRLLFSFFLFSLTSPSVLCAPLTARADECPELQLDDHSETLNVSAYGNDGVDTSTQWLDEPVKLSKRAPPLHALNAFIRHKMEIKGRGLWANLQGVLGDANARDLSVCGLDTRWKITTKPAPTVLDDISLSTLLSSAIPNGQTKATFVDITAAAPLGPQPDFMYHNLYSPEYGIINAAHILGGWGPEQQRAPDRWSDVTWALWRVACVTKSKPPSGLNWVIQQGILHGETKDIIDHLYYTTQGPPNDWERIIPIAAQTTFTPQDHAFFALLGSPNVIGTVYMLMQHSRELGRKTIESITLVNAREKGWHISIKIVPTTVPRPGGDTSSVVVPSDDTWEPQPLEVIEPIETS